eukprot:scaffold8917_cov111-Cylindrotheca_fusiformis.AAC.6
MPKRSNIEAMYISGYAGQPAPSDTENMMLIDHGFLGLRKGYKIMILYKLGENLKTNKTQTQNLRSSSTKAGP